MNFLIETSKVIFFIFNFKKLYLKKKKKLRGCLNFGFLNGAGRRGLVGMRKFSNPSHLYLIFVFYFFIFVFIFIILKLIYFIKIKIL